MTDLNNDLIHKLYATDKKARDFGFEWPNNDAILDQIIKKSQALKKDLINQKEAQEEIGVLIHTCFCLCFFNKLDTKETLEQAMNKFSKRFEQLKDLAAEEGYQNLKNQPYELLLKLWHKTKE